MDLSARSLKVKRDVITKFLDAGLYPYTKRYLGTFKNHFSTIGLIGMGGSVHQSPAAGQAGRILAAGSSRL